jgi:hypothetical protein
MYSFRAGALNIFPSAVDASFNTPALEMKPFFCVSHYETMALNAVVTQVEATERRLCWRRETKQHVTAR